MSPPRWFTGTDSRAHLVYELELTNAFPIPITVDTVEVRDADRGTVLSTMSGDRLRASMSAMSTPTAPLTELPPSSIGVVWVDVGLSDPSSVPLRVDHTLTVSVPPGLPVPSTITDTGGTAAVDRRAPTTLGAPLTGTGWIALPSCCDGPHRRSVQPVDDTLWLAQRFAIDFNKIDEDGLLAVGDRGQNSAWFTYDQPVLAVADARVVAAADGYPDQVPEKPTAVGIDEADGNYVILELDTGIYAFYAHLRPGSVSVKVGDRVSKGEHIAQTGNSGSTTGSHLHFQLMDRPSALAADGLPFEFDHFTVIGRSPPLDELVTLDPTRDPVVVDPAGAGPRTTQLPLSRDVVTFPDR